MSQKEIYTRTKIYDDGSVAVADVTEEIIRMRREAKKPIDDKETLSTEQVADLFKFAVGTVRNKISSGFFVEGKHYKRLSKKKVIFYKKPLMSMLGMR